MPHFAIVSVDGHTHGTMELGRPTGPTGRSSTAATNRTCGSLGRIDANETEHHFDLLVVEET